MIVDNQYCSQTNGRSKDVNVREGRESQRGNEDSWSSWLAKFSLWEGSRLVLGGWSSVTAYFLWRRYAAKLPYHNTRFNITITASSRFIGSPIQQDPIIIEASTKALLCHPENLSHQQATTKMTSPATHNPFPTTKRLSRGSGGWHIFTVEAFSPQHLEELEFQKQTRLQTLAGYFVFVKSSAAN